MWAPVVAEADPVADHAHGVLLGFEAVAMGALLLPGADGAFDHAVLPWALRGDEFLLQAVAAHQPGVDAAGEHQAVVRAQQERRGNPPQRAEARQQCLLQGRGGRAGLATARDRDPPQMWQRSVTISSTSAAIRRAFQRLEPLRPT